MFLINKIPETDFCHNFLPLLMSHLSFAHDLQFCALWFQTIPGNSGIIRRSIRDFLCQRQKVKLTIGSWHGLEECWLICKMLRKDDDIVLF